MAIVKTDDKHYKDIADAIREFSNIGDITMQPASMAGNIAQVYDYGYDTGRDEGYQEGVTDGKQAEHDAFWDCFQQNGERSDYEYAFCGSGWTDENYSPKYPICGALSSLYRNSGITNTKVPLIMSNGGGFSHPFYGTKMETIVSVDVSFLANSSSLATCFNTLTTLKDIHFEGAIRSSINVANCPLLTHESLMSIVRALDSDGWWTLTLGSTNIAKLTEEELLEIEAKGWTYK